MGSRLLAACKPATPDLPVAGRKQQQPAALDDGQVKRLLAGKTPVVRKTVTGRRCEIFFGMTGRRLVSGVEGKALKRGEVANVLHRGEMGSPADYRHHDMMRRQL